MLRQIKRNILKREMGTNDINEAWYQLQVAKYGPERYAIMRNKNRKKNNMGNGRRHYVGPRFSLTNNGLVQELVNNKC